MTETQRIDASDLRRLAVDLKELENGRALTAALRRTLKAAADPMVAQVRQNASWSTRIPAAVSSRAAFTAKNPGVSVFVSRTKAPHARVLENDGNSGSFLHPLWGRPRMVSQQARPFLFAETERHMPQVEQAVAEAMEEAARAAGFR